MKAIFWILFIFQFSFWLILSLTEIGRKITLVWALLVTMGWGLNVYFNYFPLIQTGNISLGVSAIKMTVLSGLDLLLRLVVPPWVGLIAGTVLSGSTR